MARKKKHPPRNPASLGASIYRTCGHYEQVKAGQDWKCVTCGQILTVTESIQNAIDLSQAMSSAITSFKPLNESLEETLGRREWEEIRARIPTRKNYSKRRRRVER